MYKTVCLNLIKILCSIAIDFFLGSPSNEAQLEVGDQIFLVDGSDVSNMPHDEVAEIIYKASVIFFIYNFLD